MIPQELVTFADGKLNTSMKQYVAAKLGKITKRIKLITNSIEKFPNF